MTAGSPRRVQKLSSRKPVGAPPKFLTGDLRDQILRSHLRRGKRGNDAAPDGYYGGCGDGGYGSGASSSFSSDGGGGAGGFGG
eukprot:COSAG04_NODE_3698_length_2598_cov_4.406748_5_plen_82_part_01